MALVGVAQLVRESSYKKKGNGFNFQSGLMPRWQVQYLVGVHMGGNG